MSYANLLPYSSLIAEAAPCDLLIVRCLEVSDFSSGGFIFQKKEYDFRASPHRRPKIRREFPAKKFPKSAC